MPKHSTRKARQQLPMGQRARSIHGKQTFVVALVYTLIFYLTLIAFLTSLAVFFFAGDDFKHNATSAIVTLFPICAIVWLISYFKRRKTICPLCRSTPFLDNKASKHQKSFRVKPFNYGTTAVLNTIFTQRWTCMYCGTPFDILKLKNGLKGNQAYNENHYEKK